MPPRVIHWFRRDLRIIDNPALLEAARTGEVFPVFIFNPSSADTGEAGKWWLHHSLASLNRQLKGCLRLFAGAPEDVLPRLAQKYRIQRVHWNRTYEPAEIQRDTKLKETLKQLGLEVRSYNAALLWEPWEILKQDGTPYRVFTPYYQNGCLNAGLPRAPIAPPAQIQRGKDVPEGVSLDALHLLPKIQWDRKLEPYWNIGETAAEEKLRQFTETGLNGYKEKRDFPALPQISRLSPHLHWGEISPHRLWEAVANSPFSEDAEYFRRELAWREFSYYLLYHFPDLPEQNFNRKFDRFPWIKDDRSFALWQQGQTGIPMVDAGMRELWTTGFMHNRVRMITASFLAKNLLIHWHHGRDWFADCLVDADLANNNASWQWVAGCGADAAPYFRIFNPVTQGQKFDPQGDYIRRFIPELSGLPDKYLFSPWNAPTEILKRAGVRLGKTYPRPIVDLKSSRLRALEAYAQIKE